MPESPLVSIVILNYNGKEYLQGCIDSVLKNSYPNFEVIVVDNASTDNSLQQVQEVYGADPRLRIIRSAVNLGFSGGNNIGVENSSGQYIAFLNNDTLVKPDWLNNLVEVLEADPTIGIAQSLIYQYDGKSIQTAGWLFSDYLIKKYAACADKPSGLQFKPVFDVSFVCGASMVIRREILDSMGAFELEVPFFYDDTLLSLKTQLLGKRVVTIQGSKMYHVGGATKVWNIRFTTYNLFKAKNILIFDIFQGRNELIKATALNIANVASEVGFNLTKGNVSAVLGNIEAFFWTLRNFPFIWQSRVKLWSKTVISPEQLKNCFVRLNIPVALYLFPSKITSDCLAHAVEEFERSILKE